MATSRLAGYPAWVCGCSRCRSRLACLGGLVGPLQLRARPVASQFAGLFLTSLPAEPERQDSYPEKQHHEPHTGGNSAAEMPVTCDPVAQDRNNYANEHERQRGAARLPHHEGSATMSIRWVRWRAHVPPSSERGSAISHTSASSRVLREGGVGRTAPTVRERSGARWSGSARAISACRSGCDVGDLEGPG